MAELHEIPFEQRTYAMVRDHYYYHHPILRAHDELVQRYNTHDVSINQPSPGGYDTLRIAEMALRRIGRPPRDRDDVLMAEQYIRTLQSEMRDQYPAAPSTLAEAITSIEFAFAASVLTAEEFQAMPEVDQRDHVKLLVSEMGDDLGDHLREALLIALPEVYSRITADDEVRRRKAALSTVD